MRSITRHFTYANVMSTLAVFLLLGGSAYAAGMIPGSRITNASISGKKLKAGSVSKSKLRANAVTGSRVAPNTLTDREVNMSRLGKIKSASSADNAGKVDGKDASQLAVKCPSGTKDLGSACSETGVRAAVSAYAAAQACVSANGYLPSAADLVGADRANKITVTSDEWSSDWSGTSATLVSGSAVSGSADAAAGSQPYRCFYALRER